ncbi:hypothetical protein [Streptomyces liliifuscus]|uniref:hypothetical protein n=1 Tax=Streptomyces liliifuscus TaxID=2797636 RepID=UPI001F3E9947|nr:hypothetical protein [Streptomyces liliifuscus]
MRTGGCLPSSRSGRPRWRVRRTFSLARLYEVVQVWQARVASALAVDVFLASGRDETGFVDLEELRGRRR